MSHTPVPEKINRDDFYNVISEMEGVLGSISQFSADKASLRIADKLDEIIDWAHSVEKRMEEYAWPKHVTGAVEQSIIDQHVTMALATKEQPSEVVRPYHTDVVKLGEDCTVLNAQYTKPEAAEDARKMLLGE